MVKHPSMRRGCVEPLEKLSTGDGTAQPCHWTGVGRQLGDLILIPGESSVHVTMWNEIDKHNPIQLWRGH